MISERNRSEVVFICSILEAKFGDNPLFICLFVFKKTSKLREFVKHCRLKFCEFVCLFKGVFRTLSISMSE